MSKMNEDDVKFKIDINPNLIYLTGAKRLKVKPLTAKEMTPSQRAEKRIDLLMLLKELEEAIHYAKQDVAAFVMKMDISHSKKREEANRALEALERDLVDTKRQLSEIDAA